MLILPKESITLQLINILLEFNVFNVCVVPVENYETLIAINYNPEEKINFYSLLFNYKQMEMLNLTYDQLKAIVAHELSHIKLGHLNKKTFI